MTKNPSTIKLHTFVDDDGVKRYMRCVAPGIFRCAWAFCDNQGAFLDDDEYVYWWNGKTSAFVPMDLQSNDELYLLSGEKYIAIDLNGEELSPKAEIIEIDKAPIGDPEQAVMARGVGTPKGTNSSSRNGHVEQKVSPVKAIYKSSMWTPPSQRVVTKKNTAPSAFDTIHPLELFKEEPNKSNKVMGRKKEPVRSFTCANGKSRNFVKIGDEFRGGGGQYLKECDAKGKPFKGDPVVYFWNYRTHRRAYCEIAFHPKLGTLLKRYKNDVSQGLNDSVIYFFVRNTKAFVPVLRAIDVGDDIPAGSVRYKKCNRAGKVLHDASDIYVWNSQEGAYVEMGDDDEEDTPNRSCPVIVNQWCMCIYSSLRAHFSS